MTVLVVLLLCVVAAGASPVRTYDQRQQGELNIHAQLDNIVIVLVPSSNFDLFGLRGVKLGQKPDKEEILQFLQKPHKNDIDRYEVIKDENDNDIKDVSVAPSENGGVRGEKEEEVVATVEEMKPEPTEKATDTPKSEATEDSPIKHSTVSESVQELVLKVSVPEEMKQKVENPDVKPTSSKETATDKPMQNQETVTEMKVETTKDIPKTGSSDKKEESSEKKDTSQKEKDTPAEQPAKKLTIEDFIKPIAAKEEKTQEVKTQGDAVASKKTSGLIEGGRREKVIRYKAESKWAPGLVEALSPVRSTPRAATEGGEGEEGRRFAALCAPGTWDTELRTCIMPGETRSRHEMARLLEALRFGIAIPKH